MDIYDRIVTMTEVFREDLKSKTDPLIDARLLDWMGEQDDKPTYHQIRSKRRQFERERDAWIAPLVDQYRANLEWVACQPRSCRVMR